MESIPAATAATAAQPADFAPGGYDIPTLQGYAQRAAAVLRQPRCQALIPALMVDTLIHDHLSRLLPHTWRHVLQTSATVPQVMALAAGQVPSDWPDDLKSFVEEMAAASLPRQPTVSADEPGGPTSRLHAALRVGCKPKKEHEIERMAALLQQICAATNTDIIVDFGSGKGYLGSLLAAQHSLHVVAVECAEELNAMALDRSRRATGWVARQRQEQASNPDLHAAAEATAGTMQAVTAVVGSAEALNRLPGCHGAVVAGLHTCGDLQASVLRIFAASEAKAVVSVGCCYHKHTAVGDDGQHIKAYPLSRAVHEEQVALSDWAMELACHPLEEWMASSKLDMWRHTHRALLQVVLARRLSPEALAVVRIGRMRLKGSARPGQGTDFNAFANFARAACAKALPPDLQPSDDELLRVFTEHGARHIEIVAMYALRTLLGAVVETLVVCDRALYLHEALKSSSWVKVHALFDPQLSPRNFAICAVR